MAVEEVGALGVARMAFSALGCQVAEIAESQSFTAKRKGAERMAGRQQWAKALRKSQL
jgi:hypothetical protein